MLDSAFSHAKPHVILAPMDWRRFLQRTHLDSSPMMAEVSTSFPRSVPVAEIPSLSDRMVALGYLKSLASRILGLPVDRVSTESSLFDLGLDSLTSLEMRNNLQETFSTTLPVRLLFEAPTLEKLYDRLVDETSASAQIAIQHARISAEPKAQPISAQQRRWLNLARIGYGTLLVPVMFKGRCIPDVARSALVELVKRCDVLSWRFGQHQAYSLDAEDVVPPVSTLVRDLASLTSDEQAIEISRIATECRTNLPDFSSEVPWRVTCLNFENGFLMLLTLRHLEFDGVSVSAFTDLFRKLYRTPTSRRLEEPTASLSRYSDFVRWQTAYMEKAIETDRAFFEGLYAGAQNATVLDKHDGFRPTKSFLSGRVTVTAPPGTGQALRKWAAAHDMTPFALMSAAYVLLISEIANSDSVVIGTILSGRSTERFASTIGPFVAPFPVPVNVSGRDISGIARSWSDIIVRLNARSHYPVADLTTSATPFHGYPFDSYFTDAFIMFNNYRREKQMVDQEAEVLESLGPVTLGLASHVDNPFLQEIAGLFLIIDLNSGEPRFNFWHHLHRFPVDVVNLWAERYLATLARALAGRHK